MNTPMVQRGPFAWDSAEDLVIAARAAPGAWPLTRWRASDDGRVLHMTIELPEYVEVYAAPLPSGTDPADAEALALSLNVEAALS